MMNPAKSVLSGVRSCLIVHRIDFCKKFSAIYFGDNVLNLFVEVTGKYHIFRRYCLRGYGALVLRIFLLLAALKDLSLNHGDLHGSNTLILVTVHVNQTHIFGGVVCFRVVKGQQKPKL